MDSIVHLRMLYVHSQPKIEYHQNVSLMLYNKNLKKIYHVKNVKIVYFDTRAQNEQWVNHPCGLMYRTIFFFTNLCEPELAHCLQTLKMHRNSTSLDSCQHDDINIVTVSVARRRWTAPLKPRRPCVKHFTTFYALLKHVSPKADYFTHKGHFF